MAMAYNLFPISYYTFYIIPEPYYHLFFIVYMTSFVLWNKKLDKHWF